MTCKFDPITCANDILYELYRIDALCSTYLSSLSRIDLPAEDLVSLSYHVADTIRCAIDGLADAIDIAAISSPRA